MNDARAIDGPTRELLVHRLYEAAELEHCLMCTYLYAAFSLRRGEEEGLHGDELAAVERWRRAILKVAVEEMGHLVSVWNITAALGGAPRFGRMNFPLDPGYLPARIVVKLAPFSEATLQHFVFLERPAGSNEPDGAGFEAERLFVRGNAAAHLTPMALDYETVGAFYETLGSELKAFVAQHGEAEAFCGDRALQLSSADSGMGQVRIVVCLKTALEAFHAIVLQGEGAPADSVGSHYRQFVEIREELAALKRRNPAFVPAYAAATNPVLRRPPRPEGRVWLEDPMAIATVDLANASYGLMLRLVGYAYAAPSQEKRAALDTAIGLMRAIGLLGAQAARLPAGASNAACNAGMTFTTLRDAAAFSPSPAARRFFVERLSELCAAAGSLAKALPSATVLEAARILDDLRARGQREFEIGAPPAAAAAQFATPRVGPPALESLVADGIESAEGRSITLRFEARRCIHARHCVTGAPTVFLANVQGPWLHPDAVPVERLVEIAHACPSGAIRYTRKDGAAEESAPPVNLLSVRESGPYGLRAALVLDGKPIGYRATLCRCGASRNKPFCDGSHHDAGFQASGEPATGINASSTAMLPVRDGPLEIDPQLDGPLAIRGNLEVVSGTGRMVCRFTGARLCRCGGSSTKPFCDGTHARIGFRSL